jgi:hypothetical protein
MAGFSLVTPHNQWRAGQERPESPHDLCSTCEVVNSPEAPQPNICPEAKENKPLFCWVGGYSTSSREPMSTVKPAPCEPGLLEDNCSI